jgi:hypothetical protein
MNGIQIELPQSVGGDLLGRVVELRETTTTTTERVVTIREDDDEERETVNAEPRIAGPIAVRNERAPLRKAAGEGGR